MILDWPHVDFIHTPPNYISTRDQHYPMYALDSPMLHGKLYINQIDAKTWLYDKACEEVASEGKQPGYVPQTEWETLQYMKRDTSFPFAKRCAASWL